MSEKKVRVFILDDHQSIVDGYVYRLSHYPNIEVVGTANYGDDVEPKLAKSPADVAILDVQVYTSPDSDAPYPILHLIPRLLQQHPELNILAISMFNQSSLIKAVMEAGANGYVLKDDIETLKRLGEVITSVAEGGIHFSARAYKKMMQRIPDEEPLTPRQLEMISLCAAHPTETSAVLGGRMGIANSTSRNLLSQIYLRLGVHNRVEAVLKARRLGLITPNEEFSMP